MKRVVSERASEKKTNHKKKIFTGSVVALYDLQVAADNWTTVGLWVKGEKRKMSLGLGVGTLNEGTLTAKAKRVSQLDEEKKGGNPVCVCETRWKEREQSIWIWS